MGKIALWSFLFIPSQLLSYEVCSLKEGAMQTQLRTEISYSNFHSYIISSWEEFSKTFQKSKVQKTDSCLIALIPAGGRMLSKIQKPNFFQTYPEIKDKILPVQFKISNF